MNNRISLLILFLATFHACNNTSEKDQYPLGPELQILANDLEGEMFKDYKEVLKTMNYPDLRDELFRVVTPDNYIVFREKHGGLEKVMSDSTLKKAYLKRKEIARQFIELIESEIKGMNKEVEFDEQQIENLMAEELIRTQKQASLENISINPIMPAERAEDQWPGFRGPTSQGIVAGNKFPKSWSNSDKVIWKTELSGRGNSSPVIWENKIFITTASEDGSTRELFCYNRQDGKLIWKKTAPAPTTLEKIHPKNSYASSTPVTDGERVVVFFGNSGMVCYNFDGELLWRRDLGEFNTTHGPGTCPVLYKDKVIFIQDQNKSSGAGSVFVALDKSTGKIVWTKKRKEVMGWSNPILLKVGQRDELIYNGSHQVKAYDPDTGEEIWSFDGTSKEAIPMIVSGGGLLYSCSGRNGPIMAIRPGGEGDITDTHLFWKIERGGAHVPSPTYYKNRLYMVNDTGVASCLDAMTGETIWRERLKGRFSMSPLLIGDQLLVTNERGLTTILKTGDTFEIIAQNDLHEEMLCTPAVLDGMIYFRTSKHLYCIGE